MTDVSKLKYFGIIHQKRGIILAKSFRIEEAFPKSYNKLTKIGQKWLTTTWAEVVKYDHRQIQSLVSVEHEQISGQDGV